MARQCSSTTQSSKHAQIEDKKGFVQFMTDRSAYRNTTYFTIVSPACASFNSTVLHGVITASTNTKHTLHWVFRRRRLDSFRQMISPQTQRIKANEVPKQVRECTEHCSTDLHSESSGDEARTLHEQRILKCIGFSEVKPSENLTCRSDWSCSCRFAACFAFGVHNEHDPTVSAQSHDFSGAQFVSHTKVERIPWG